MIPFNHSILNDIPEPEHINHFFYLYGLPEKNIHCIEDIQIYLDKFPDWDYENQLNFNFLSYIKKTYKNVLISLENFDTQIIYQWPEYLTINKVKKLTADKFIREKLATTLHFIDQAKVSSVEKESAKIPSIEADFKHSKKQANKLLQQIENEIENLEYHLSLSTNTEYKTLDEKVNEDTIKHKLIWFGTEKELDVLLHLWQKENLINKNANINLCKANFVDKDYSCYSTEEPIKIQWMGLNTELAYSLGLLIRGTSKLLSDEWIWAKSEQIFLNKNNKRIKNLSVAYQSTPTRFDFLKSLVKKAINK